jgi:hypothetical protein
MKFPWLTDAEIEASAAQLVMRTFGPTLDRSRPVELDEVVAFLSDTEQLSYNDEADLRSDDGEVVLGKTQPLRRRILLSRDLKLDPEPGRSRFTLAHELGHWVLHRPLFLAKASELSLFGPQDEAEFEFVGLKRAIFREAGGAPVAPEEWQANRFAVALLIDSDVLREEFQRRFGALVVARRTAGWLRSATLRDHSRLLATGSVVGGMPLRDVFGLSAEAMAVALEARGYAVEEPPML